MGDFSVWPEGALLEMTWHWVIPIVVEGSHPELVGGCHPELVEGLIHTAHCITSRRFLGAAERGLTRNDLDSTSFHSTTPSRNDLHGSHPDHGGGIS
jgi:hypothetical protein